jgi:serine/threonine protein kinase
MEIDELLSKVTEVAGYKVLPPCVIYAKIGQGGMGAVYRGHHLNLDIDVAVKCLKPSLVADDPQFVARFRREGQSAARINHQNVIRVFDVAEDHGLHYLIMEMVQGETARQRVDRKGPLAVGEALQILFEAAQGLGAAHHLGIVHRDIKPDNLLVSTRGHVKVADLGLAKPTFERDGKSMLSSPNQIMGTPSYMPPEQWEGGPISPAADVWALGATLWFLLVGREAIVDDSPARIMSRIVMQPFPDVQKARGGIPADVAAVIAKATAKDPGERYLDAGDLADAIGALPTRRQSLRDARAGTTELRTLVSPPPIKNLEQIKQWLREDLRTRVQTPGRPEPGPVKTELQAGPGGQWPDTMPTPAKGGTLVRPQRRGAWGVAAVAVIGLLAGGYALFGRSKPEPDPQPKPPPPQAVAPVETEPRQDPRQQGDPTPTDEPKRETDPPRQEDPVPPPDPQPVAPLVVEQPTPPPPSFVEADRRADAGDFEGALRASERVFEQNPTLAGKNARLAAIHQRWSQALREQQKWLDADLQLARAAELAKDDAALRRTIADDSKQLRQRIGELAMAALRLGNADAPAGPGEDAKLRGSFKPPFACDLLLGGTRVPLAADGTFEVLRTLTNGNAVAVAIRWNGDDELTLSPQTIVFAEPPPPTPTLAFVRDFTVREQPNLAADGFLATSGLTIAVEGELNVADAVFEVNDVPVPPQMRAGKTFVVVIQRLTEGLNEVKLKASSNGYRDIETKLKVLCLTEKPQIGIDGGRDRKNWSKRKLPIRVDAKNAWLRRVTATVGGKSVELVRDTEPLRWLGEVEIEAGKSKISIEAVDYAGRKAKDEITVSATPATISELRLQDPGAKDQRLLPLRKDQFLRPGTRLFALPEVEGAELLVDDNLVAAKGGIDLAPLLREGERVVLRLTRRNEFGVSAPLECAIVLDGTPAQLQANPPEPQVGNNRVTCTGTWSDVSGIKTLTVNGVAASFTTDATGKAGTWSASVNTPVASTSWKVIATDVAGNVAETAVAVQR